MDSLRGRFSDRDDYEDRYDLGEDDTGLEPPPSAVGQDERRMQVRAYNHWASLLGDRSFPSIEDLDPANLPDFSPYSVLLDFTGGVEDPGIPFLGARLAHECLADGPIGHLSDVPSRSLLSRITDHYMQILANQAPIGFEAEFVNGRGATILYRGILLPFSSDDETIDFIYGVINWKELADQKTSDELLLEIDQALNAGLPPAPAARADSDQVPPTAWADGPSDDVLDLDSPVEDPAEAAAFDPTLDLAAFGPDAFDSGAFDPDTFDLGLDPGYHADPADPIDWSGGDAGEAIPLFGDNGILAKKDRSGNRGFLAGAALTPRAKASDEAEPDGAEPALGEAPDSPHDSDGGHDLGLAFGAGFADGPAIEAPRDAVSGEMGLADWLASAREMAQAAQGSEDRSRAALYAAIGRAYDFSLAAQAEPDEFAALVADAGLAMQDRAPMTPVVKLVFGANYDKTRLTEYAAALSHGHRLGLGQGALAEFLATANGGLKGVVQAERALKREEAGKVAAPRETPRDAVARKLRKLDHRPLEAIAAEGSEFTLLVARRLPTGEVVLLGEVGDDAPMLERAARRLLD